MNDLLTNAKNEFTAKGWITVHGQPSADPLPFKRNLEMASYAGVYSSLSILSLISTVNLERIWSRFDITEADVSLFK